jgi:hypothetical protein
MKKAASLKSLNKISFIKEQTKTCWSYEPAATASAVSTVAE